MNSFRDSAIKYAERGLAVFPLKAKGKEPLTRHGVKDATTDIPTIEAWWNKYPNANIGMACGKASGGLLVIDLDEKPDGTSGNDSLHEWEAENGDLPETVRSITGRGGSHILYRADTTEIKNKVGLLPGIDIRSEGGYFVAPPSVHPNGHLYQWEYDPEEYEIAQANERVIKLVTAGKDKSAEPSRLVMPERIYEGQRNDMIFKLACSLQAKGLSDQALLEALKAENREKNEPPLDDSEVENIAKSATRYDKGHTSSQAAGMDLITVIDKKGNEKIRQCAENVARVILNDPALSGKIKYNTHAQKIIYLGQLNWKEHGDTMGDWTDSDDANLRSYCDLRYNLRSTRDYEDGFRMALACNHYNPLTGYLDALVWDGIPRIENALTVYLGADPSKYNIESFRVFLQGAVHRAYDPGCKFDLMLVLIGRQGDGKSTFFRLLACNDNWFNDNFNFRSTDSKSVVEKMNGKWILEMAEMESMKKDAVTADAMKSFITSQSDIYRVPFDKRPQDLPRQCVFCGTSNDVNFLKDRTGNRRFLPIDTNKAQATKDIFDFKTSRPYFQQVIAEAVHYYKQHPDEPPVLPKELESIAVEKQSQHLEVDPWVALIEEYLSAEYVGSRVNAAKIWADGFKKDAADMKRADTTRILTIMRNDIAGWHEMEGKQRVEGYGTTLCFERDAPTGFHECQAVEEEILF